VQPNEIIDYKVEIFPLGYIFRPGHKILIQIHTPPVLEKIWGYTPTHHQPAVVSVHHSAEHPSWIQWPVVTTDKPIPGDSATPCPLPGGFYCLKSPLN
jgi:predicted acyl esterase